MKKKLMLIMALAVIAVSALVGCTQTQANAELTKNSSSDTQQSSDTQENLQIATPFTEVNNLAELSGKAGFEVKEPQNISDNILSTSYIAFNDGMAEIIYQIGDEKRIVFRKAKQSDEYGTNISGNYNTFSDEKNAGVVTLKGNDGKYSVALWQKGDFVYSYDTDEPLSEADILEVVSSIE